jgi:hypothetical protein
MIVDPTSDGEQVVQRGLQELVWLVTMSRAKGSRSRWRPESWWAYCFEPCRSGLKSQQAVGARTNAPKSLCGRSRMISCFLRRLPRGVIEEDPGVLLKREEGHSSIRPVHWSYESAAQSRMKCSDVKADDVWGVERSCRRGRGLMPDSEASR